MLRRFPPALWAFVIVAVSVQPARGKCINLKYSVTITARERTTNAPIPNAEIVLFLPDDDYALAPPDREPAPGRTDTFGRFTGVFSFNTYSGWLFGDRCRGELSQLEVVIVPQDRPAERFWFRGLKSMPGGNPDAPRRLEALTAQLFPAPIRGTRSN
jgi:hypothetical protein